MIKMGGALVKLLAKNLQLLALLNNQGGTFEYRVYINNMFLYVTYRLFLIRLSLIGENLKKRIYCQNVYFGQQTHLNALSNQVAMVR